MSCRRFRLAVAAAATLLLTPTMRQPALAQQPDTLKSLTVKSLTLGDAVTLALTNNASLRQAKRAVDGARGGVMSASGAFDPNVQTSVQQSRTGDPEQIGATQFATLVTNQTSYSVSAPTQLRNGVLVTPQVAITRSDISNAPGASTSHASAQLSATIPMWQDRGGGVSRAPEHAAISAESASAATARHTAAQVASSTALAYWNFRAASDRLAVYQASETRGERLVQETAALVRADERPASDLVQVRASLVAKRTLRIGAEQTVQDTWRVLDQLLGGSQTTPPAPTTPLPESAIDSIADSATLLANALHRRFDVAAAIDLQQSARATVKGSELGLRSRFDMQVAIGYVGADQGWGVDRFFSPLLRTQAGVNLLIGLKYQAPVGNERSRGAFLAADALYEQRQIALEDLRREVVHGVVMTSDAAQRSQRALAVSDSGVVLSQQTVDATRRKFQLGASTLLDVLTAEDGLTAAQLAQIGARQTYVSARVNLGFESGTLFDPGTAGSGSNAVGGARAP
jgi:outer membrane protein TolC